MLGHVPLTPNLRLYVRAAVAGVVFSLVCAGVAVWLLEAF